MAIDLQKQNMLPCLHKMYSEYVQTEEKSDGGKESV